MAQLHTWGSLSLLKCQDEWGLFPGGRNVFVVSSSLGPSDKSCSSFSYLWSRTASEQFLCCPTKLASLYYHKVQPWNFCFWEEWGKNNEVMLHFWVTVMHPTLITCDSAAQTIINLVSAGSEQSLRCFQSYTFHCGRRLMWNQTNTQFL